MYFPALKHYESFRLRQILNIKMHKIQSFSLADTMLQPDTQIHLYTDKSQPYETPVFASAVKNKLLEGYCIRSRGIKTYFKRITTKNY